MAILAPSQTEAGVRDQSAKMASNSVAKSEGLAMHCNIMLCWFLDLVCGRSGSIFYLTGNSTGEEKKKTQNVILHCQPLHVFNPCADILYYMSYHFFYLP